MFIFYAFMQLELIIGQQIALDIQYTYTRV